MDLREWNRWVSEHKNTKPYKKHIFLFDKLFEDVRQDEKHVPDLLESIIQPPGPVKEELRQKLFKITQFESRIERVRVSTFGFRNSEVFAPQANTTFSPCRF